jgi:hypothetical protein
MIEIEDLKRSNYLLKEDAMKTSMKKDKDSAMIFQSNIIILLFENLILSFTKKKYVVRLLLTTICLLFHITLSAQNSNDSDIEQSSNLIFNGQRHKLGLNVSYGFQNLSQILKDSKGVNSSGQGLHVDYTYKVTLFQIEYYYTVLRKKSFSLEILVQPQYNLSQYKINNNDIKDMTGYELGLNAGLLARKSFFKDLLSAYLSLSSGPHYISNTPMRQANGFIFSDNLFGGLNIKVSKNIYVDLRTGFRHLSNAGLKQPNGGINTLMLGGGFFVTL